MKLIDPAALAERRAALRCDLCRRTTPGGCEPHHYIRKGMAGGQRLDHRLNLLSACGTCHRSIHGGDVPRHTELDAIARREKMYADEIAEWLWTVQRLPRGSALPPEPGMVEA